MKIYWLTRDFGCPTSSYVNWAPERDGRGLPLTDGGWSPREDLQFTHGGNTWSASGPLTAESKAALSGLWAVVKGTKKPLSGSHVLGDYGTQVTADVIVDETFVAAMQDLDPSLFEFTPHERVWDRTRNCAPWDGAFFIATLLPLVPSYDLDASDILPRENIREKYRGAYASSGARRAVRATSVAGRLIWRDSHMRHVLCSQPFLDRLRELGVPEWQAKPIDVIDDLN